SMADLLPISERLYDLSILLVFRFDDTYEHDVLLNHHIPVEEVRGTSLPADRILASPGKQALGETSERDAHGERKGTNHRQPKAQRGNTLGF
ncbi:MAG: hypothetical protein WBI99_04005, partial [Limnochordia bacterium]|nr:hypothetical protein [Bacillota bacterium]